jgi:hypothetical protein
MRRNSRIAAAPLILLATLAGCRDGVVSPATPPLEAPSASAPAPMRLAPQGRPRLNLSGELPDSAAADFTVGPNGGVFFAGNHAVVFPAQSVCDPATSSYGPSTWDQPCTLLQTSLKVHAEVRRQNGQISIDFTPSLRFAPSSSASRWVWIVMYTPDAIGASADLSQFNILWAKSLGGATVDESQSDSTLRTYVDTFQGLSLRRIKHFSGYTIDSGRKCDPGSECSSDPSP